MGTGSLVKRSNTGQGGTLSKQIHLPVVSLSTCLWRSLPALSFLWPKSLQNCLLSQGRIFLMAIFGPLQADFCLFTQRFSHHYCCTHFTTASHQTAILWSTDLLSFPVGPSLWTPGLPLLAPISFTSALFKNWCSVLITSLIITFLNICSLTPF